MDKETTGNVSEPYNHQIKIIEKASFALLAIFAILIILYSTRFASYGFSTNPDAWGQFGDYLGGILNPLVSLTALLALVVNIRIQRSELNDTRAELIETRKIATEQSETAKQQRREQRFFDLLNLYQRTVDTLRYTKPASITIPTFHGKSAIQEWLKNSTPGLAFRKFESEGFHRRPQSPKGDLPLTMASSFSEQELNNAWNHLETSNFFDPYFRVIYRILSEAEELLGEKEHFRYVKLLRAQLNRNELTLLAYNMWLDNEGIKMRPLAAKYGLLKHLPAGRLRDEVEKILPQDVFGRQKALV